MRRRLALTGMAAIIGATGWLNHRWMVRPVDVSPIVSQTGAPALSLEKSPVKQGGSAPELQVSETLLRPLFHVGRRPFVPPPPPEVTASVVEEEQMPPPVEVPPVVQPDLRLAGVSNAGGTKRVLLGLAESSDVRWYAEGDNLEGWIVASITNQTVTMARDEVTFVVSLYPTSDGRGGEQ